MFYNVFKPLDEVDIEGGKFQKKVLMEDNNSSLNLIALKKDEIIDTHTSEKDAALYVLEGEIEIHFTAEKFELKKGEMILFKKDDEHKVLAKKDSKFIVFK